MIETLLQWFYIPKTWTPTERFFLYFQTVLALSGMVWAWFYPATSPLNFYQGVLCGALWMMVVARWWPATVRPVRGPFDPKPIEAPSTHQDAPAA